MQEVSQLVQDFDERIVLSADRLYERFGRENGQRSWRLFSQRLSGFLMKTAFWSRMRSR